MYSLAAMLRRYLPEPEDAPTRRLDAAAPCQARALVRRLLEVHDAELPAMRPHAELIALAGEPLRDARAAAIAAARLDARRATAARRERRVADAGDADRAAGDVAGGAGGEAVAPMATPVAVTAVVDAGDG